MNATNDAATVTTPTVPAKRRTVVERIIRKAPLAIAAGLIGIGLIAASAGVANAQKRTLPDGSTEYYCVYDGKEYSPGSKVYPPGGGGTYQLCRADGTWLRTAGPVLPTMPGGIPPVKQMPTGPSAPVGPGQVPQAPAASLG